MTKYDKTTSNTCGKTKCMRETNIFDSVKFFNPFLVAGPILYAVKTPEKQMFSRVFKGHKRLILTGNSLKSLAIFVKKLHHWCLTRFFIRLCRYSKSYRSSCTWAIENPSNSINHNSEIVISMMWSPGKILEITLKTTIIFIIFWDSLMF